MNKQTNKQTQSLQAHASARMLARECIKVDCSFSVYYNYCILSQSVGVLASTPIIVEGGQLYWRL